MRSSRPESHVVTQQSRRDKLSWFHESHPQDHRFTPPPHQFPPLDLRNASSPSASVYTSSEIMNFSAVEPTRRCPTSGCCVGFARNPNASFFGYVDNTASSSSSPCLLLNTPASYVGDYQDMQTDNNGTPHPHPHQHQHHQIYQNAPAEYGFVDDELVRLPASAFTGTPPSCYHHQPGNGWSDWTILGANPNSPRGLSLSLSPAAKRRSQWRGCGAGGQLTEELVASPRSGSNNKRHLNVVGPLGPFTGYAAILESSKFLRPAEQLLEEFLKSCEVIGDPTMSALSDNIDEHGGAGGGSSYESSGCRQPDVQYHWKQKKATLLILRGEVARRYRQYYEQMEMVFSSFQTVAGLSAATPYISLALKTISMQFRCLKNAISNQLRQKVSGDQDYPSSLPNIGSRSSGNINTSAPSLKFMAQGNLQNHKLGGINIEGFLEPQQHHTWRPHRGLPERSVAILRAWLFDHFLHPYPTDSDKQMLATRTGLSRNQVSNWFINARVRLWKPMVEEMHMLETNGFAEAGLTAGKEAGKSVPIHTCSQENTEVFADIQRPDMDVTCSDKLVESYGTMGSSAFAEHGSNVQQWYQEKRPRMECHQLSTGIGGPLISSILPYDRPTGFEIGGIGAVSLTLGLKNNMESAPQQPEQLEHNGLGHHFRGQIIHYS